MQLDTAGMRKRFEYVRGVSIFAVAVGHFSSRFLEQPLPLYSGYLIAFFFIVSGYGIHHSLTTRIGKLGTAKGLASFFVRRAVRLYPVYWLWLALDLVFDPASSVAGLRLAEVLLFQFHDPPQKWFLHAIVLCYLFAPLFFFAMRRTGKWFLPLLVAGVLVSNVGLRLLGAPPMRCGMYLFVYLGNVFLFGFGMYYAAMVPALRLRKSNWGLIAAGAVMSGLFVATRSMQLVATTVPKMQVLPQGWSQTLPVLLYASLLLVAVLFFSHERWLVGGPVFRFLGRVSLSIYVFEGMYSTSLERMGFIGGVSDWNIVAYLALFPFFAGGCWLLERALSVGRLPSWGRSGV